MKPFINVHVKETPEVTISYRSEHFVFEEGLRNHRWITLSYNAAGFMASTLSNPTKYFRNDQYLPDPQSFSLSVDGMDLISNWDYVGTEVTYTETTCVCRVTLRHQFRPVQLVLRTELDETQIMMRSMEVTNLSQQISTVNTVAPLAGCVQEMAEVRTRADGIRPIWRVGYMEDAWWSTEGNFQWHDLPDTTYIVSGRFHRPDARQPMFVVENRITGEYFIGQMGWSGGWAFEFDVHNDYPFAGSFLSIKMKVDDPAPIRVLQPGETYVSPKAHMGMTFGGFDAAIQQMHDHIRKTIMRPTRGVYGWIESAIGPETDMSQESTMRALEYAIDMGAEVFFIDAGWFVADGESWENGTGEWRVSTKRYPEGLTPFREKAHANGLLFGLWASSEDCSPNSKIAKEHPDWLWVSRKTGETPGLINMGIPEAAQWVENNIRFLIDEYGIDFFRIDGGTYCCDGPVINMLVGQQNGYTEPATTRHYEGVYAMFRRLREDYPNVIFENCSVGGARCDLGMLENFTHTWVTDYQKFPNAVKVTNGMTMALPPEVVDRLVVGQSGFMYADLQMQLRNALFARMSLCMPDPVDAEPNPRMLESFRKYIQLYKNFVRPMYPDANTYHHTPALEGADLIGFRDACILETDAKDGNRGMIGVFGLITGGPYETVVHPRGIDVSRTYKVTFDNSGKSFVIPGFEIARNGFFVRLGGALTSELILYQDVETL